MKKKLISTLLCATMIGSLLTAAPVAASEPASGEKVKIGVSIWSSTDVLGSQCKWVIDEAAKAGADTSAIESLPEQFASFNTATIGLAIFERCGAMLFHVAMSILVFYAVKKARPAFYLLAILLHALLDSPAALYQKGIITNQLVLELIIAAFVVTVFVIIYKTVYSKYTPNEEVTEIA